MKSVQATTIAELIEMAGGPSTNAYSRGMVLERFDASIGVSVYPSSRRVR